MRAVRATVTRLEGVGAVPLPAVDAPEKVARALGVARNMSAALARAGSAVRLGEQEVTRLRLEWGEVGGTVDVLLADLGMCPTCGTPHEGGHDAGGSDA